MGINGTPLRARSWKCGALQAATIIAVAAGCGASSANEANAAAQGHKGAEKVATPAGEAYFESILPARPQVIAS